MAITRIKTNQITDAAVTAGKIADLAVTAGKLADNLSYDSDFTVTGNLTVSGTTTSVSTTNTRIEDKILALASEATGTATHDAGILINRGNDANQAFLWDESANEFVVASVGAEDGDTAGNVTLDSYAGLHAGAVIYGSLNDGTTTLTSTAAELNLLDAAQAGTIVNSIAVIYGSGGEVNATKLQLGGADITSTAAELNLVDGITAGTASASLAVILDSSKDIAGLNDVSAAGLTLSDLTDNRITIAGTSGILEDDANFTFDGTTLTVGGSDSTVFSATVAGVVVASGAMTVDGLASLDGGINVNDDFTVDTDGNAVAVGLTTTGVMDFNNATTSTSTSSGAVQVTGGVGITENLFVGGTGSVAGTLSVGHDSALVLGGSTEVQLNILSNANLEIKNTVSDGDIVFVVNDGGSSGTAMFVDGATSRLRLAGAPVNSLDAATKAYADSVVSAGSTLTIAADVGSNDTVTVGTDTFTFEGTSGEIETTVSDNKINIGFPTDITIAGNLTVSGTTTTVASTVTTIADPIITLGSSDSDDNKDRGIEFKYNSGGAKTGFFGFDDSTAGFIFIADATNTNEVFSGTAAAATFGAVTATDVTATGSFIIGSASMNEVDLEKLDGISNGTGAANKAVVLGASNAISTGGVVTATGFTIGSAVMSEADLEQIDGITAGTAAASKAVVLDSSKDIAGLNDVSAAGITLSDLTDNRVTIAGSSGILEDDANFTFDGTTLTVGGSDSTVFSATVAGVVVASGAMTVDGLASLDGGINTNDDFTVDADGNVVAVGLTTTGVMDFNNATTSTSSTSGAVQVTGGVGVAENIFAGGTINAAGVINANATTTSTSVTTGSAVVDGGLGVAENIFAGGFINTVDDVRILADNKQLEIGAGTDFTIGHDATNTTIANATGILAINSAGGIRINEDSANVDVVIESNGNATMFMVDGSQNNIGIGGSPNANAVLHINDTGALILATGTTAQRPGTGVVGMFRFNSTLNDIEFAKNDGSFSTVAVDFTVATTQAFSGDGSTVNFTLSTLTGNDTYIAAGVLVMLNGVVQNPADVYSIVSATTLRFSTAPASGDVIEVRKLTTASTITGLTDTDGDTQIQMEESDDEDIIRFDIAGTEIATIDSGGITLAANKTFDGTATSAQYADLAEMYATDSEIDAGTVVHFSGEGKVAACDVDACSSVAGIVSTDPAYLMNSGQEGAALALAGRVPCKVTGPVAAGDMMVSAGNGMARAEASPAMGTVIGKAIEANESGDSVIEVLALMM